MYKTNKLSVYALWMRCFKSRHLMVDVKSIFPVANRFNIRLGIEKFTADRMWPSWNSFELRQSRTISDLVGDRSSDWSHSFDTASILCSGIVIFGCAVQFAVVAQTHSHTTNIKEIFRIFLRLTKFSQLKRSSNNIHVQFGNQSGWAQFNIILIKLLFRCWYLIFFVIIIRNCLVVVCCLQLFGFIYNQNIWIALSQPLIVCKIRNGISIESAYFFKVFF